MDDVLSSLSAMKSQHLDEFVKSLTQYPPSRSLPLGALRDLVGDRPHLAPDVAALAIHVSVLERLDLLNACANATVLTGDDELVDRLVDGIDDLLRSTGSGNELWERWASLLADDSPLVRALGPMAQADWLIRSAEAVGDQDNAAAIALRVFQTLQPRPEFVDLAKDLIDTVESGLGGQVAADLRRQVTTWEPVKDRPAPHKSPPTDAVRVLFLGGNETQQRMQADVESQLATTAGIPIDLDQSRVEPKLDPDR